MLARQSFFSLVFIPLQIVNRNYIYTILYLPEDVHTWRNNQSLCVYYNKGIRSDHRCDLGIEGQTQIYLKPICLLARNTNSSFMFLTKGVHSWHNGCLWCVYYTTKA